MNLQIENSISRIFDQAISRYQALLTGARQQTGKAAGRVVRGKKPVKAISKLSLKLTAVTHRTADKVLKQQAKMVENQIDAVAGRLRAAAESRNLRELVGTQIRLIPVNASQFAKDTRAALTIVAGAGSEVGGLVKNTVAELRGVPVAKTPKAPRKTKKVAAKTATKKKAVKAKAQPVEEVAEKAAA
jgi:hypothetical protein